MDNFNNKINRENEKNIDFGTEIFEELVSKFKSFSFLLNLKKEDMYFYYERIENNDSILGIKITKGDITKDNFAFILCHPYVINKKIYCDVEMYADKGNEAMRMARLFSRDIVQFFEKLENKIYKDKIILDGFIKKISLCDSEVKENSDNRRHMKLIKTKFTKK